MVGGGFDDALPADTQERFPQISRNFLCCRFEHGPVVRLRERRKHEDFRAEAVDKFPGQSFGEIIKGGMFEARSPVSRSRESAWSVFPRYLERPLRQL